MGTRVHRGGRSVVAVLSAGVLAATTLAAAWATGSISDSRSISDNESISASGPRSPTAGTGRGVPNGSGDSGSDGSGDSGGTLTAVAAQAPPPPPPTGTATTTATGTGTGTGVATTTGTPAAAATTATAVRSPLDALPAGKAPTTVPYAIGSRLFFAGRHVDLVAQFLKAFPGATPSASQRQFVTVIGGGGFAWTQIVGSGVDVMHVVGRVSTAGRYTAFHASSGGMSPLDVSAAGVVATPENGQLFRPSGSLLAAFTGSARIDCGFCATSVVGTRYLVDQNGSMPGIGHVGTWLWYPPSAIQRLPDGYRALGRLGAGWLGVQATPGCWRTAPATAPTELRTALCSQTRPLVSADGTAAVVVQGARARVLDTRTGATRGVASLAALATWSPYGSNGPTVRYLVPAAWETTDSYLLTARDGNVLALVRCSVTSGRCQRVVRALARTGVSAIVTERGSQDAYPTP